LLLQKLYRGKRQRKGRTNAVKTTKGVGGGGKGGEVYIRHEEGPSFKDLGEPWKYGNKEKKEQATKKRSSRRAGAPGHEVKKKGGVKTIGGQGP